MNKPIDLFGNAHYMGEAIRQAGLAFRAEEVPVGAVIVFENRIIARAYNQVELLKDATAHAEMLAITQAEAAIGDWRLNDCAIFVTKEPCAMCAGAMLQSRIGSVIYGASDPQSGAAGSAINLLQFPRFNHRCEIERGIREEECARLLKHFFQKRRKPSRAHLANGSTKAKPCPKRI